MAKAKMGTASAKASSVKYVDGFVLVIPKKNLEAYKKMASEGEASWKKHGALDYKECVGEDLTPEMDGGVVPLSFLTMTKCKPNETVIFSYIGYKSRKHRDEVNTKVMKEMSETHGADMSMPFDIKRTAYGGFEVIVGA